MGIDIEQHRILDIELGRHNKYAKETPKEAYHAIELWRVVDGLVDPVGARLQDEITTILEFHDQLNSKTLVTVYAQMTKLQGRLETYLS